MLEGGANKNSVLILIWPEVEIKLMDHVEHMKHMDHMERMDHMEHMKRGTHGK